MQPLSSHIHSAVPVVSTDDIGRSIEHYSQVLGFTPDFEFGDPVAYAGVKSGEVDIYFSYDPELTRVIREKQLHPEIFLWVSDADHLYEKHVANGAEIIEAIADRPWGAR